MSQKKFYLVLIVAAAVLLGWVWKNQGNIFKKDSQPVADNKVKQEELPSLEKENIIGGAVVAVSDAGLKIISLANDGEEKTYDVVMLSSTEIVAIDLSQKNPPEVKIGLSDIKPGQNVIVNYLSDDNSGRIEAQKIKILNLPLPPPSARTKNILPLPK